MFTTVTVIIKVHKDEFNHYGEGTISRDFSLTLPRGTLVMNWNMLIADLAAEAVAEFRAKQIETATEQIESGE